MSYENMYMHPMSVCYKIEFTRVISSSHIAKLLWHRSCIFVLWRKKFGAFFFAERDARARRE